MATLQPGADEEYEEKSPQSIKPLIILIGLLLSVFFVFAVPVAWVTYKLLTYTSKKNPNLYTHLRPRVIGLITFSVIGVVSLIWYLFDFTSQVVNVFKNPLNIMDTWQQLIIPDILMCIALGMFVGWVLTVMASHSMATTPHVREVEGSWEYHFEYRRTPTQYSAMKKKERAMRAGEYSDAKKTGIGLRTDYQGRDEIVCRYATETTTHTLIFGSTGSGKTMTMLSMIENDIRTGNPTVIVDYKASPVLTANVVQMAEDYNRPMYHFMGGSPDGYILKEMGAQQSFYIPLSGDASTQADIIFNMRSYDQASEVYKTSMRDLLTTLFSAIEQTDPQYAPNIVWDEGALIRLASVLEGDNLTELAIACQKTEGSDPMVVKSIADISKLRKGRDMMGSTIKELQGQVRTLVASDYGRWLRKPKNKKSPYINLFELTKPSENPPVILFSFSADKNKDFASYMGALVFADITRTAAMRREQGISNLVQVYGDEFQAVPVDSVRDLFEKARASEIGVTLSSQSINQLAVEQANQEAMITLVLDVCDNFYIHHGSTQDTAERFSKIVGQETKTLYSVANRNERWFFQWNFWNKRNQVATARTERDYKYPPEYFMSLEKANASGRATAVVINKSCQDPKYMGTPGATVRTAWVIPPDKVLNADMEAKARAEEMMNNIRNGEVKNNILQHKNKKKKRPVSSVAHNSNKGMPKSSKTQNKTNQIANNDEVFEPFVDNMDDLNQDGAMPSLEVMLGIDSKAVNKPSQRLEGHSDVRDNSMDKKPSKSNTALPSTNEDFFNDEFTVRKRI